MSYFSFYGFKFYYKINNLETYPISEDSLFLLKNSFDLVEGKILECCSGSGFIGILLSFNKKVNKVYLYDIDFEARIIEKVNVIINNSKAEIINKIPQEEFDFLVFNPPYLPKDEYYNIDKKADLWTIGGEEGIEITLDILQKVNYKKAIFLASSRSNLNKLFSKINYKILDVLDLGFEKLYAILSWKK